MSAMATYVRVNLKDKRNNIIYPNISNKIDITNEGTIIFLDGTQGFEFRPKVEDNRYLKIVDYNINYYSATGGWASGMSYYTNDGETKLGDIAGFGQGNELKYYYFGHYNAPLLKMTLDGNFYLRNQITISNIEDGWLRLNNAAHYTNGIYCGSSAVRTDGSFQIGSGGSAFHATASGNCAVSKAFRIPKNPNEGYGLTNIDGISIIKDYNNQNVTVNATGQGLYLGYTTTDYIRLCKLTVPDTNGIDLGSASNRFQNLFLSNILNTNKTTTTYLAGNQGHAIINSMAGAGSYTMLAKMNSTNGVFTIGTYQGNFELHYTANSTINAGTNGVTKQVFLLRENGDSAFPGTVSAAAFNGNASTATTLADAHSFVWSGTRQGVALEENWLRLHSFVGSIQISGNNAWCSLINVRHRGGGGDGNNYGWQILNQFGSSRIQHRSHSNGNWTSWYDIPSSVDASIWNIRSGTIATWNANYSSYGTRTIYFAW